MLLLRAVAQYLLHLRQLPEVVIRVFIPLPCRIDHALHVPRKVVGVCRLRTVRVGDFGNPALCVVCIRNNTSIRVRNLCDIADVVVSIACCTSFPNWLSRSFCSGCASNHSRAKVTPVAKPVVQMNSEATALILVLSKYTLYILLSTSSGKTAKRQVAREVVNIMMQSATRLMFG